MSKRNAEFFEEKKDWSRIKDTLLGAYLPVYFQKVIHAKKPIVYKERVDDETRRVLFCFLSDPYQPLESELHLTQRGISVAARHGIKVDILTKGDGALIEQDLPLMLESQTHLGITLSFINDTSRCKWEPMASTVQSRLNILRKAHEMGIYTWLSMEPVIIPQEALEVIRQAHGYVDFWKVGCPNRVILPATQYFERSL